MDIQTGYSNGNFLPEKTVSGLQEGYKEIFVWCDNNVPATTVKKYTQKNVLFAASALDIKMNTYVLR